MQVKQLHQGGAEIVLSGDELLLIGNALNEVCHGLDVPEFATRMGAEREVALELLRAIQGAHDQVDPQTIGRD